MSPHLVPVYSPQEVAARVAALGEAISREYHGKDLLLLGVLKGAFIFLADLARAISLPAHLDFVRISSYGQDDEPGRLDFCMNVSSDLRGRHVLVVEDIVDSGRTMAALMEHLKDRGAASVRICALIDKTERRQCPVSVDFWGFRLEKGFAVGYGLDFAEDYRCLPGVFELLNDKDA